MKLSFTTSNSSITGPTPFRPLFVFTGKAERDHLVGFSPGVFVNVLRGDVDDLHKIIWPVEAMEVVRLHEHGIRVLDVERRQRPGLHLVPKSDLRQSDHSSHDLFKNRVRPAICSSQATVFHS
jgi:hypothetical protein